MAVALSSCVLVTSARAEDRLAGYAAGGLLAGVDQFLQVGLNAEAGIIPPHVPIALHVGGMYGGELDAEGGGSWYRIDVGADLRIGLSRATTLLVGPTLGRQIENWGNPGPDPDLGDPPEHYTGSLIGGRIGVEAKGAYVNVRVVLENYAYRYTRDGDSMQYSTSGGHLIFQASHAF